MRLQPSLFNDNTPDIIIASQGDVRLYRHWLQQQVANNYFQHLLNDIPWQQSFIRMHGKTLPVPRLHAWYGDADCHYRYSGMYFLPLPWTHTLLDIKTLLEKFLAQELAQEVRFNSVLLNLYRDGQDSVAWHADDEPELGKTPIIASVSLGVSRRFSLKPKLLAAKVSVGPIHVDLPSGSLLLMAGETQRYWLHQLPKTRAINESRINMTFRWICPRKKL